MMIPPQARRSHPANDNYTANADLECLAKTLMFVAARDSNFGAAQHAQKLRRLARVPRRPKPDQNR
jgi:hypothetical protein